MNICFLARYLATHTEILDTYEDDTEELETLLLSLLLKHSRVIRFKTAAEAKGASKRDRLRYEWMTYLLISDHDEWDGHRITTVFNPNKIPDNACSIIFHDLIDDLPPDVRAYAEQGKDNTRAICWTWQEMDNYRQHHSPRFVTICYRGTSNIEGCYRVTFKYNNSLYLPKKAKSGFTHCYIFHNKKADLPKEILCYPDFDKMSDYVKLMISENKKP